jgi:hypothetical protein
MQIPTIDRLPFGIALLCVAAVMAIAACGGDDGAPAGGAIVTADQFRQIPVGASEGELRYELGEPANEERIDGAQCLDYREGTGDGIGRAQMFRFCIRGGRLVSKDSY